MIKAIQFMLLAALVVSVSGCANTNHPQAIRESSDIEALRSEIDENAVPKETLTDSFSESKTSSDDSVIDVKAETESSQAETPSAANSMNCIAFFISQDLLCSFIVRIFAFCCKGVN